MCEACGHEATHHLVLQLDLKVRARRVGFCLNCLRILANLAEVLRGLNPASL